MHVIMHENSLKNLKKFTSTNQPTHDRSVPAMIRWEIEKEKGVLMDSASRFLTMTLEEFSFVVEDMKANPANYTVRDKKVVEYIESKYFITDWLDRNVPKADKNVNLKGEIKNITVDDFMNKLEDPDKPFDEEEINNKIQNKGQDGEEN
jgi:hypothetical protein